MKTLFCLLVMLVVKADAYEEIFQATSIDQIEKIETLLVEKEILLEQCQLFQAQNGFLWPCFYASPNSWSRADMDRHCEHQVLKVNNGRLLPEGPYFQQLTELCKEKVRERRRVLDYKAKGP